MHSTKTKLEPILLFSFSRERVKTIVWKKSMNQVKLRSWTEVSETNTMETSAREGEGLSRSRPLAPKMKWVFFLPIKKEMKVFHSSPGVQKEQEEPVVSCPPCSSSCFPSASSLFFFKGHKVLKEFLSPFQWRRSHILFSATVRPQMSRPNKACCIVKTKRLKIKRNET